MPSGRNRLLAIARLVLLALSAAHAPAVRAQGVPDLAADATMLAAGLMEDLVFATPDACTLQPTDRCLAAPGARRVIRFHTLANNVGTADLFLGNPLEQLDAVLPSGEPKWVFSTCHNHYHFQTFAAAELRRRGEATRVLESQKRAFCVEDTLPMSPASPPPKYCCNEFTCPAVRAQGLEDYLQGLQVGWGDFYPSFLDCQWIDVTDVPPGDYDLCVSVNTARILPDADPANDSACVPVTLALPEGRAPRVRLRTPRARRIARAGQPLRIAWKSKIEGEIKFQELWLSRDNGATWEFVAGPLPVDATRYEWMVPAGAVSRRARVRIVVWAKNPADAASDGFRRAEAVSTRFRIRP